MHHVGLHYSSLFLWEVQEHQGDQNQAFPSHFWLDSNTRSELSEEKTGHKHLFPFKQQCPWPCWREFWLLGDLEDQPICCSELCRSLFVPHWSLSVMLSGDGLKVWLVLPLWSALSVNSGLLPWLQGHLSGRIYKASSLFIRNDLFFPSVKPLIRSTASDFKPSMQFTLCRCISFNILLSQSGHLSSCRCAQWDSSCGSFRLFLVDGHTITATISLSELQRGQNNQKSPEFRVQKEHLLHEISLAWNVEAPVLQHMLRRNVLTMNDPLHSVSQVTMATAGRKKDPWQQWRKRVTNAEDGKSHTYTYVSVCLCVRLCV